LRESPSHSSYPTGLHEATAYVAALREPLERAFEARRRWTGEVRRLVERAAAGDLDGVLAAAGPIGEEYGSAFSRCRVRLLALTAPPVCAALHASAVGWFDELVLACRVLQDAAGTGELDRMLDANTHLVAAAQQARLFNAEYEILSAGLRSAGPSPLQPAST